MRIAVLNWSRRVVGGTEEYLRKYITAASAEGHDMAFWYETDSPADRQAISPPPGGEWSVAELGPKAALAGLRDWRPDLIYAHGLLSPALESEAYRVAPTVFFAHGYYGTCISGAKTTWFPAVTPCTRTFGPACFVHFYTRRCGGLNPVTMWREYRTQSSRLELLRRCDAIVTHSDHMRNEYLRHGLPPERVFHIPYYVNDVAPVEIEARPPSLRPTLLFLGRMEPTKGGHVLLDALSRVRSGLQRPVRVIMAGEGSERPAWESHASSIQANDPQIQVEFPGWVDSDRKSALFQTADLMVVPSLWPEPFGQVGPDAGRYGLPVVAFDAGGTSSWLSDGINGFIASSALPKAESLADAIVRALDPTVYPTLRQGAVRLAARFTWANHCRALHSVFEHVLETHAGSGRDREATPVVLHKRL